MRAVKVVSVPLNIRFRETVFCVLKSKVSLWVSSCVELNEDKECHGEYCTVAFTCVENVTLIYISGIIYREARDCVGS